MEENMSILISEYLQDERKASVYKTGDSYTVNMYDGETLRESRNIEGHTADYAEEAAENWVLKVIK